MAYYAYRIASCETIRAAVLDPVPAVHVACSSRLWPYATHGASKNSTRESCGDDLKGVSLVTGSSSGAENAILFENFELNSVAVKQFTYCAAPK